MNIFADLKLYDRIYWPETNYKYYHNLNAKFQIISRSMVTSISTEFCEELIMIMKSNHDREALFVESKIGENPPKINLLLLYFNTKSSRSC